MTDTATKATPLSASSIREVEETVARISSHKGVEGVMILNCQGAILQSTWKEEERLSHASMILQLTKTATQFMKSVEHGGGDESSDSRHTAVDNMTEITPPPPKVEDLSFVRIRSKKHEIMVAPDKDYLLVVLTNPNATMEK
eukprot:CAMPEP_0195260340 /NCGR_PEP_ID=MMETSP0706-20130129/8518_1 /TAXON_ID=33640 /ORGANISM="Asterionellopsis glacialis, Strain CCMP134" /LENGTH=141 /DNA_ID=CAMNT_0040314045 /DNA_START=21 /DNA_END=446 /DNA_ORIENTATION=+